MNLANLLTPIQSDADLQSFSFSNADHHQIIFDALLSQKSKRAPTYILDPFLLEDKDPWLWRHQDVHNFINEALNIPGNDLTDVDLDDPNQLNYFQILHYNEHLLWNQALGIFTSSGGGAGIAGGGSGGGGVPGRLLSDTGQPLLSDDGGPLLAG